MELFNLGIEQFNINRFDPSVTSGTINRLNPANSMSSGGNTFEDVLNKMRGSTEAPSVLKDIQNSESGNDPHDRQHIPSVVKDEKLYQLCLDLETFLVKNLLSSMRSTVQKSGLIDEGFAGKIYEDMLYDEYAKDFTKTAGFGLAEQAYRQLTGRM